MSKTLTLPSGSTAVVRKLNVRDVQSLGMIPDVLADDSRPVKSDQQKNLELASKMTTAILTRCVIGLANESGKPQFIFDTEPIEIENEKMLSQVFSGNPTAAARIKDLSKLPEHFIRLSEFIGTPDATFIVSEVMALSGFGGGAAKAAAPFPEVAQQPPSDLQPIESIPSSSN